MAINMRARAEGERPRSERSDKTQIELPKRAVVRRINARLRSRHERLYLVKSHAAQAQGTWFVLDEKNNSITAKGHDLEAVARSLQAIQPFERLAQ